MSGETFRIVERLDAARGWVPSRECEAFGCMEGTRQGKPYCPEHLDQMPYVAHIMEEMDARDAEREACAKHPRAHIDIEGIAARETLRELGASETLVTVGGLARTLSIPSAYLSRVVAALSRAGLVTTGMLSRGAVTVALVA